MTNTERATWAPAEEEHFLAALPWRNADRAGLRTSPMLSRQHQSEFVRSLSRTGPYRYWAFGWTHVLAGLTNIQDENGLAEMSLIVNPGLRRQGLGTKGMDFILEEAFDRMRLLTVCVECYHCAPGRLKFWEAQSRRYAETETIILPRRKWWDGRLWDSTYFTFTAEGYRLARQATVPA